MNEDDLLDVINKSGHFSITRTVAAWRDVDVWDASFIDRKSESGCYYAATIKDAIKGAMKRYNIKVENDNKKNISEG